MKNSFSSALRCKKKSIAIHYGIAHSLILFLCITIFTGILFTSCQKEVSSDVKSIDPLFIGNSNQISTDNNGNSQYAEVVNMYSGLSSQTIWELQQARAATARYRDIRNAIRDGYSNINVDVSNMGHHFMKTSLIDATFDIRHPEILVYNGLDTGNPILVAVEYAVPLDQPLPEGFTGSGDVWNGTSGFPFWLVHAWVWKYNPAGVFNWTNPSVDLD
ncbi:hypothetical protein FW778_21230 [Ginsengibacter hankyongi]|uniref:Uncharacterized protein n=1 Tax=Ginsengibacter hankyongi TaxID=2607284 RepID=A0A5J5IE90_9BACT|nr:hypothetical protein [Ginsengibacter hankyongi]KAA9035485.1 hypothetical protein FW778_21230 [Ginsengibacter hankyongi]